MSDSLRPHELQHARPPCPSPTPGVHSDSCPSSWWYHPAISSSVVCFSSCPQSLPASESFPISQLFAWGGQSTGVSALPSFLPKKSQGWSPSEWTGWISLQSKGLSRVFSNTTIQKHQFFSAQPSSQSNSHIHMWSHTDILKRVTRICLPMQEIQVLSLVREDPLEKEMAIHSSILACAKTHEISKSWTWLSNWTTTTKRQSQFIYWKTSYKMYTIQPMF